jgi:hypothetical protein
MWTPVKLNNGKTSPYGFGWSLEKVNKHRLIDTALGVSKWAES